MNKYIFNLELFIKEISKKYYRTSDKIKIVVGEEYKIYLTCIDKKENKYVVFKLIIKEFNKSIIDYIKDNLIKKEVYLNKNKNYIIYNVYKK